MNISATLIASIIIYNCLIVYNVHGHAILDIPLSRASAWTYDKTRPVNNNDDGLNCGDFSVSLSLSLSLSLSHSLTHSHTQLNTYNLFII